MPDLDSVVDQLPNLVLPTLGGKQIWGDVFLYGDYRIQECVLTRHHRLLGPGDLRLAWGSFSHCHDAFLRAQWRRNVELRSDHLVLLLHGIFRSKDSFGPMTRALRRAGYEAQAVNYPSTRRSIQSHADQVEMLLDRVEDVRHVSFVTHSMGGMVAREVLSRSAAWRDRVEVNRLVMIGTPNRGARMAGEVVRRVPGFDQVAGPALQQLLPENVSQFGIPDIPFGVVAGVRGDGGGYNPFLEGDDDMTVSLASALLDEAEDTLVLPAVHTFIMVHPKVVRATQTYLETGRFVGDTQVSAR